MRFLAHFVIVPPMLMIRLQRLGRAHDPSYRLLVTEKTSGPRAGKYVEELGHYDARLPASPTGGEKGKDLQVKAERVLYWLSVGAKPSGTVHNLLVREGIIKGKKRDVRPSKTVVKPEVAEVTPEPAKPAEPAKEIEETIVPEAEVTTPEATA